MKTEEIQMNTGIDGSYINGIWTPNNIHLTKREYFAAMAMQGFFANPNPGDLYSSIKMSVEAADALLTALNNKEK